MLVTWDCNNTSFSSNRNIIHFLSGQPDHDRGGLHITLRKDQDGRKYVLGWENNFHVIYYQ